MKIKHLIGGLLASGGVATVATPAYAETSPYLGQISLTAATFCAEGWVEADGQLIAISGHTALFRLFGTTYGGDGRTTMGIPDMRGRGLVGTGQSPSGEMLTRGTKLGGIEQTLTVENLFAHSHTLQASPTPATLPRPIDADLAEFVRGAIPGYSDKAPDPNVAMADEVISETGDGEAFNTRQATLVMRYCVATSGNYPTQP